MDVRRLGSKYERGRTPSVQGIIVCPLLEEIHLGLDDPKHQAAGGCKRSIEKTGVKNGRGPSMQHRKCIHSGIARLSEVI